MLLAQARMLYNHSRWSSLGLVLAFALTTMSVVATKDVNSYVTDRNERQQRLDEQILRDCIDFYGDAEQCVKSEQERLRSNLQHFDAVHESFTQDGFHKDNLPKTTARLLERYWANNKGNWREERWPIGDTTSNHWASPTYRVELESSGLRGGKDKVTREAVVESTRERLEAWTGEKLRLASASNIRVYTSGAVVSSHTKRLPRVAFSALINVAQDLKKPWPLELLSRDGETHQILLLPGEMVLIETSSVIQGFPVPLQGKSMANMVVHFELATPTSSEDFATIDGQFHAAAQDGDAATLLKLIQANPDLAHLQDGNGWTPLHEASRAGCVESLELLLQYGADLNLRTAGGKGGTALYYAAKYLGQNHPVAQYLLKEGGVIIAPGIKSYDELARLHAAAHEGNIQELSDLLSSRPLLVGEQDSNGWTALDFAVRSGNLDCVKLLVQEGADLAHRTNDGLGASGLFLAEKYHGKDHPVSSFLMRNGGLSLSPTLDL
jgi:26S proteasome non-ATPase regulatory subunit 10